ncbi:uncharacterized protein PgNI_11613 [Pyricularia grisea]|uniref:Uncharacterized protein n=1 Tax=Pyricularia grisea TaxID=148305 RepID=A0A6P8ANM7_PYRGI|nr:uncharacterized protein PgNI_11613 [Pyricularia grisea]TLD03642.1 hypothetical protein PgNI_11613 [Pyricularia grisea]
MALGLDAVDADMLEMTEKEPKLPEDRPKFPLKKPQNPFRATPCIYRYYIHGSSTAREAQFLARKAPLSVNTSEAFAWAAGILSDPNNLPATGLSDLKGIVDRFRGRLAECCRERGQKALVNKTDIQRALVSLGWTTAKTTHENPGLEDTIQKYEEARNAKFAELEQLKSAIEAAKLDLRDAENAHDTAKKAKENFELQEDYNRVLLFSWTVCAGGVDQLGKWSHEYPCEFELLCNAAKAMMTTTPSSNSGFTSQK